jgi:choline dehydrogenase-like flavoprotein
MVQTADVVVVGGGVNGTSIAYALASKGRQVRARGEGRRRERRLGPIERARAHALHERVGRAPRLGELSRLSGTGAS